MTELIFHHYPNSPFSKKIRLIFGIKQLAWRLVITPAAIFWISHLRIGTAQP